MIQRSIKAINLFTDFENIGSDVQEVLEMLEKISGTFEEIFKQELPEFLRKKYIETTKVLRKSALSLGLGCAGLIPYVSNIARCYQSNSIIT